LLANLEILGVAMIITFFGSFPPYHPLDYLYNYVVRPWIGKPKMPPRTNQGRFACRIAIGAVDLDKSYDVGIAVIRYIRDETDPTKAEVALTVIDEYQNRGIGIHLYNEMLGHAYKNGIKLLVNCVIKENTTMLNILEKIGGEIKDSSGNQYLIEVKLPGQ
jgi:GNAT superfamily N-acetyltransferase